MGMMNTHLTMLVLGVCNGTAAAEQVHWICLSFGQSESHKMAMLRRAQWRGGARSAGAVCAGTAGGKRRREGEANQLQE